MKKKTRKHLSGDSDDKETEIRLAEATEWEKKWYILQVCKSQSEAAKVLGLTSAAVNDSVSSFGKKIFRRLRNGRKWRKPNRMVTKSKREISSDWKKFPIGTKVHLVNKKK